MSRGRKYKDAVAKYDKQEQFGYQGAVDLLKEIAHAKFDETVELHLNMNLKKSQTVRDTLVLPHQFGKSTKILVFAKGEKAEEAREAGADFVGDSDMIEKIQGGWVDFDVAVATPDMMRDVGRLGPVLGRRGLMPNPKTRTVTFDIKEAVSELKQGRMEFRSDKTNVVHCSVGSVSMDGSKIVENIRTVVEEVERKRPADTKGAFIESAAVASTMGPGIRIDPREGE